MWVNFLKKNIVYGLYTRKTSKNLATSELIASLRPGEIPASDLGIKFVRNQNVHNDNNIIDCDLARSIALLSDSLKKPATQTKSCRLLDDFFSSSCSTTIFTDNDFHVSKKSALEFIDLYKKAVKTELKKSSTRQRLLRDNRLTALKEIKNFVKSVRPDDPDCAALCRFAIQLCGRCREPKNVTQRNLELCGLYTVLTAGWRIDPLKLTRVALKAITDFKVKVPGSICLENYLPHNQDYTIYSDPLADKVLISLCFALDTEGTLMTRERYFAGELGFPIKLPLLFRSEDQIINGLQVVSKNYPVSITTEPELMEYFQKEITSDRRRKPKDCLFVQDCINPYKLGNKHVVLIENFSISLHQGVEHVIFKLTSLGGTVKISMPKNMFKKYFHLDSCMLIGESREEENSTGVFA